MNSNTTLLTQEEAQKIEKLMRNPDPTSRLSSNYYQLRQREILNNFQEDIVKSVDYNDRVHAQQRLQQALQDLRTEYEADVSHSISLHLSTLSVWVPWGNAAA